VPKQRKQQNQTPATDSFHSRFLRHFLFRLASSLKTVELSALVKNLFVGKIFFKWLNWVFSLILSQSTVNKALNGTENFRGTWWNFKVCSFYDCEMLRAIHQTSSASTHLRTKHDRCGEETKKKITNGRLELKTKNVFSPRKLLRNWSFFREKRKEIEHRYRKLMHAMHTSGYFYKLLKHFRSI
jgi:hypothetical protein